MEPQVPGYSGCTDDIIARRQTFTEYVRYLADRGEYGAGPGVEEQVRHYASMPDNIACMNARDRMAE